MVFSVYLGVITENVQPLMLLELHISDHLFNIIFVLISVCYLIGIFIYRSYADIASKMHYRLIALLAAFLCVIYLSFASFNVLNIAISLLVLCLIMGFIVPLSTGSAMAVIEFGHGTAAATLTFSVSMIMAIWSFIQAHSSFSIYHFLMLSLWVTFIIVGIVKSVLCIAEIKAKKMQLNLNKA